MLEAALLYASLGWKIFPVHYPIEGACSCGDKKCASPAKHPIASVVPNGCKNAQSHPAVIRVWWAKFPLANIGLTTGRSNNLYVLDIDVGKGGDDSLIELEKKHGPLVQTDYPGRVLTGSGGYHYYYKYPKEFDCNNKTGIVPGIDIRAEGGYVVAPPSKHICGGNYAWEI